MTVFPKTHSPRAITRDPEKKKSARVSRNFRRGLGTLWVTQRKLRPLGGFMNLKRSINGHIF